MKTKDPILLEILRSFSKKEMNAFHHFLRSPSPKPNKVLLNLLDALKKEVLPSNAFDARKKVSVFHTMKENKKKTQTPLTPKEDAALRIKMSDLTKEVQQFLAIEALKENTAYEQHLLNLKLLEKQPNRLFSKLNKIREKKLEKEKAKSIEEFESNVRLAIDKMNYINQQSSLVKEDNFSEIHYYLDLLYLSNKLRLFNSMQSVENVNKNKTYNFVGKEAVIKLLNIPAYAKTPLVHLYVTCSDLIKKKREKDYKKLRELLESHDKDISKTDLIGFYDVALNFLIGQIREGQISPYEKIFLLYKEMESKDSLMDDNFINYQKLKNCVTISCRLGEFVWANKIINKYCPRVKKDIRNSVLELNFGVLEFYKKNYRIAIKHLIKVDKVDLEYEISGKILLIKSYYEIDQDDDDYDERTIRTFNSVSSFIRKQKRLSPKAKKGHKNFIELLINLYRIRHHQGKMTIDKVVTKMEKMNAISDPKWIQEKIDELRKWGY